MSEHKPESLLLHLDQQLLDHTRAIALPVQQWNPPCLGDMDLRIARSGIWYHEGRPIEREGLVKVFARILRRDADGCYYLVTPVERWRIQVEDAPFVAVEMQISDSAQEPCIFFRSNVDDWVMLGPDHPIRVDTRSDGPAPYVLIRGRLQALLNRAVYYELAEYAEEHWLDDRLVYAVRSQGMWFSLADVPT